MLAFLEAGATAALLNAAAAIAIVAWRMRREPRLDPAARVPISIAVLLLLWGVYEPSARIISSLGTVLAFAFLFIPRLSDWFAKIRVVLIDKAAPEQQNEASHLFRHRLTTSD